MNDFFSKNKLKDVNDNDNNNNDNKEDNLTISKRFNKIYTKKKQDLNEVIPIKEEENESIKEDEKESDERNVEFNLDKKEIQKNKRKKEEKDNMKSVKIGKNFNDFFTNSLMFKICGSMQVNNSLNRDEDIDNFLEEQEEVEEEVIPSENINKEIKHEED